MEPDFARLPSETPAPLGRVLQLCLSKDAKLRVHDIADVRLAMDGAFATASAASEPVALSHRTLPWPVAVVASLLTGLGVWSLMSLMSLTPPETLEVTRFAYDLPDSYHLRNTGRSVFAFSPDGRQFVYNTTDGLYLRSMDQLDARLLAGTEMPLRAPFFSPDGRSVAYEQDGQLKRLAVSGGAPVVVGSVSARLLSAHWAPDDTIFIAQAEGIARVSANGGTPELVIPAADGETLDAPQLLPDGDTVLFSATGGVELGTTWDAARSWPPRSPPGSGPCWWRAEATHGTFPPAISSMRSRMVYSRRRSMPITSG